MRRVHRSRPHYNEEKNTAGSVLFPIKFLPRAADLSRAVRCYHVRPGALVRSRRAALRRRGGGTCAAKPAPLRVDAEFTVRCKPVHTVGAARGYASVHPQS
ncbi:hypothetical protein BVI2075_1820002 [Burkholderia vietnamiensis]|nr:hypothetical protein BVI2075_1820002 [Burkholderia vietnamiensis]